MKDIATGILIGFLIGILLERKLYSLNLKYKARTGIDLCENGIFYEIKFSERNENYKELKNL